MLLRSFEKNRRYRKNRRIRIILRIFLGSDTCPNNRIKRFFSDLFSVFYCFRGDFLSFSHLFSYLNCLKHGKNTIVRHKGWKIIFLPYFNKKNIFYHISVHCLQLIWDRLRMENAFSSELWDLWIAMLKKNMPILYVLTAYFSHYKLIILQVNKKFSI